MTDERSQYPKVTGAPDAIYLCVGDLEHDDSFGAIEYTGEVTWCADKQGNSDIKYVRADLAARAASAWDRFHHIMNNAGLHPGRTDDDLLAILEQHLQAARAAPARPDRMTVYAVPAEATNDKGEQLYTITDQPIPMADNWRLQSHPMAARQWFHDAARAAPARPAKGAR